MSGTTFGHRQSQRGKVPPFDGWKQSHGLGRCHQWKSDSDGECNSMNGPSHFRETQSLAWQTPFVVKGPQFTSALVYATWIQDYWHCLEMLHFTDCWHDRYRKLSSISRHLQGFLPRMNLDHDPFSPGFQIWVFLDHQWSEAAALRIALTIWIDLRFEGHDGLMEQWVPPELNHKIKKYGM